MNKPEKKIKKIIIKKKINIINNKKNNNEYTNFERFAFSCL